MTWRANVFHVKRAKRFDQSLHKNTLKNFFLCCVVVLEIFFFSYPYALSIMDWSNYFVIFSFFPGESEQITENVCLTDDN